MRRIILLLFMLPALCFADTYYWVNGAGDWANLTHWATTSGGTTYHNTVPGSGDDVIFDGNSGSLDFTINVNVTTVYTKDFIVTTGAPSITLSSGAVTYELFGSLTLNNGLDCSPGVYFWVITYREVGDSNDSQDQGTVHLMR